MDSVLVGWKYELAGTRQEALAKAHRQIVKNHTDACVLNGQAFGPGFAFCQSAGSIEQRGNKSGLVEFIAVGLQETLGRRAFELRLPRLKSLQNS